MALTITILDRGVYGNKRAVLSKFAWESVGTAAVDADDFGLAEIEALIPAPEEASNVVYSVAYDRTAGEFSLLYNGATTASATGTHRALLIGR